jgi:hypothetical protein
MDLPTTNQRVLAIRSTAYVPDKALMYLTHFFIKVDMHFTHPLGRVQMPNHPDTHRFPPRFARQGFVGSSLRQVLLGERTLTPLWRVLRGWTPDPRDPAVHMNQLDIVKLWVRHHYEPDADIEPRTKTMNVLGIPWHELGTAQMERINEPYKTVDEKILAELIAREEDDDEIAELLRKTINPFYTVKPARERKPTQKLLRVDQLVMRESVRRELSLWEHWVRMMVWGWYDPVGRRLPLWTEEELYRMMKGLPPKLMVPPAEQAGAKKDAEDKAAKDGGEKQSAGDKAANDGEKQSPSDKAANDGEKQSPGDKEGSDEQK